MRISDWSSDVCSSDLLPLEAGIAGEAAIALAVITPRQPPVAIERPRRVRNPERHRSLVAPQRPQRPRHLGPRTVERDIAARRLAAHPQPRLVALRSEEHTSELQSLMRISYAVFCLKKKLHTNNIHTLTT